MSDPFDFSDFPDLTASFQAAGDAVTALCHFQTDLDNLIRQFDLSAEAKSAAAEHNTSEAYELGVLLVRQPPHVVAGFLAQYQLCFSESVKAVETHVKPLMNELGSVRVQEFQVGSITYRCAARAVHKTICDLCMFIGPGKSAIPQLMAAHVPEWREVLEKHGGHIRPFVERYYHAKSPQPDSGAGEDGPAKTLSEVWNRVRADEPGFKQALGPHTLEVRIQNMLRLNLS